MAHLLLHSLLSLLYCVAWSPSLCITLTSARIVETLSSTRERGRLQGGLEKKVTHKPIGWLVAFATLGIQIGILAFFVMASEASNLQDDKIDIEFTWKCPRDSDACKHKADWTKAGWVIFCLLMVAFLAKDMINGCKQWLGTNSAQECVSTDIIVNSVIVLFIMEIDEYIFSAVDAMNEKWTEHAADTKVSEMEKEVARQRAQIASQQEKIDNLLS
eukprot:scaffold14622_cov86-Skeletonema_marinoi.AAC.7